MARLGDRSTGDLLVMMLAVTVCLAIIIGEVGLLIIEAVDPGADTSLVSGTIGDIINTLVGLVAGYLAGRTEVGRVRRIRPEEEES